MCRAVPRTAWPVGTARRPPRFGEAKARRCADCAAPKGRCSQRCGANLILLCNDEWLQTETRSERQRPTTFLLQKRRKKTI